MGSLVNSFSPWVWAPSVTAVLQSRKDDLWCWMLKPVLVLFCHCWTFTGLIRINFSLIQIILTVIMLIWHIAIIIEIKYSIMEQLAPYNSSHCPVLVKIKPPWGTPSSEFPTLLHTHQDYPGPRAKEILWMDLPLSEVGTTQSDLPSIFLMCPKGTLSPSVVHECLLGQLN